MWTATSAGAGAVEVVAILQVWLPVCNSNGLYGLFPGTANLTRTAVWFAGIGAGAAVHARGLQRYGQSCLIAERT